MKLPSAEEIAAVAAAGSTARGWYEHSATALRRCYGGQAPRFAALVAALSPQCPVEINLQNALRVWEIWHESDKPTDKRAIVQIMRRTLFGANVRDRVGVLPAWIPNTVRALTCADPLHLELSGPKVHSFMRNLQFDLSAVTLDGWMARFAGIDARTLGGRTVKGKPLQVWRKVYHDYSARIVAASDILEWQPAEVQECIWSWTKCAVDFGKSARGLMTIADGIDNNDIAPRIADIVSFAKLLDEAPMPSPSVTPHDIKWLYIAAERLQRGTE